MKQLLLVCYSPPIRHFRKEETGASELFQRHLGLLQGTGKNCPIADRRFPSNNPTQEDPGTIAFRPQSSHRFENGR